jgi:hypothetical protein
MGYISARRRAADYLDQIIEPDQSRKRSLHLFRLKIMISLRSENRFIKRKSDFRTPQESSGDRILARFTQRNLTKEQGFGLL